MKSLDAPCNSLLSYDREEFKLFLWLTSKETILTSYITMVVVYTYLHKYIQEFLESTWGVPNNLLKAALVDVKETMYIAGCKALGLID